MALSALLRDPEIVECHQTSPNAWSLVLAIPENLYWFQGHFPQAAILPGVVQLNWVRQLAAHCWPEQAPQVLNCRALHAIKFQHVIRPGDQVNLTLELLPEKGALQFALRLGDKPCSSGKLVLS